MVGTDTSCRFVSGSSPPAGPPRGATAGKARDAGQASDGSAGSQTLPYSVSASRKDQSRLTRLVARVPKHGKQEWASSRPCSPAPLSTAGLPVFYTSVSAQSRAAGPLRTLMPLRHWPRQAAGSSRSPHICHSREVPRAAPTQQHTKATESYCLTALEAKTPHQWVSRAVLPPTTVGTPGVR